MTSRSSRSWSLHGLALLILFAVSVVALGAFTALVFAISRVEESAAMIRRDMRSLAIADEIALVLSAYERLSSVIDSSVSASAPDRADLVEIERQREAALLGLVRDARPLAGGPRELELLTALDREVRAYLDADADLAGKPGAAAGEARARKNVALERALATLDEVRAINEQQVEQRHAIAQRIERAANLTALTSGLVLLIVIAAAVWAMRRGVLRPLGALRRAIERYRAGERDAPIPVSGPQEIVGIGTAFSDMRDELARQRAQQSEYLAGIAHDLRNPLSPLKHAVALLRIEQQAAGSERSTRTLAILDRQIDRLNRMISDLLDAARIEAGQLELSLGELDLRDVVREVTELHRASTGRHELRLELPDQPLLVRADALRLHQVVGNLLSNAIKYSPEGGAIDVRVEHDRREVRVMVRDRGIGIPPEDVRELFVPFRRRERAREVAPGVGIGLSVVRRIVEAHGGRMSVESEVGVGSTFVVHLPRSA